MNRLKVVVPGEGFGSTGRFEVRAGQVARQETPPLARLGSIEGRLDPKLAGPSTTVVLEHQGTRLAKCRMRPGGPVRPAATSCRARTRLHLLRAGQPTGNPTGVRVAPGHRVAGVMIRPAPPAPPRGAPARSRRGINPCPTRGKEVVWLEGTVRDEQGRGVAGARLFARATIDGGMRFDRADTSGDHRRPGSLPGARAAVADGRYAAGDRPRRGSAAGPGPCPDAGGRRPAGLAGPDAARRPARWLGARDRAQGWPADGRREAWGWLHEMALIRLPPRFRRRAHGAPTATRSRPCSAPRT